MTITSILLRYRRGLALCAVSALLHAIALWWIAPQLHLAGASASAPPSSAFAARLLGPAAPPALSALPSPSAEAAPAPPARTRPRAAAPAARRDRERAPDDQAGATDIAPAVQLNGDAPVAQQEEQQAEQQVAQQAEQQVAQQAEQQVAQQAEQQAEQQVAPQAEQEAAEAPAAHAVPAAPVTALAGAPAAPVAALAGAPATGPQVGVTDPQSGARAAPAPVPTYRVAVPPPVRIVLDVVRSDADGTPWHGQALIALRRGGARYRVKIEAGIRLLAARVNLVVLTSEGEIDAAGFAPVTLTEKRRGRAQTATHFNARDASITFSASTAVVARLPGAQDKATMALQLAAIARGDSAQLAGGVDLQVGDDRDASVFHFALLGKEEIDTGLGRLETWHLSRPPRSGAYGSSLDIWLAPAQGWLPVQISNIEAGGAVTTQTVKRIVWTGAGGDDAD